MSEPPPEVQAYDYENLHIRHELRDGAWRFKLTRKPPDGEWYLVESRKEQT